MALQTLPLPPELRNEIYRLALTSHVPITDPPPLQSQDYFSPSGQHQAHAHAPYSPHRHLPPLGLSLLHLNRPTAWEAPSRLAYEENTFRFSTGSHAHTFLSSLSAQNRLAVQKVAISFCELSVTKPEVLGSWGVYLNFSLSRALAKLHKNRLESIPATGKGNKRVRSRSPGYEDGLWMTGIGSLLTDAPNLKSLTLELGSWARVGVSRRHLWDILRRILMGVEGLERVVLEGSCCGDDLCSSSTSVKKWARDPWSTAYFVGLEDVDGGNELVERIWRAVDGDDCDKVARWERSCNGRVRLEVVTKKHVRWMQRTRIGDLVEKEGGKPWPVNGSCTLEEYQRHKTT